jgi:hypothetical protein
MPAILSVGTANPAQCYTQREILAMYPNADKKVEALFQRRHVQTRYLSVRAVSQPVFMETVFKGEDEQK